MRSPRPAAANEVFPANGSTTVNGVVALNRSDMSNALREMPHLAAALAPAPARDLDNEDKLDHVPSFGGPSAPAPRG